MSDTPRTDAAGRGWSPLHGAFCYVHEDLARQIERELVEVQKNYQFMVDRAANEKLDGYRELGAKAAAAEERAEKAERELAAIRDALAGTDYASLPSDFRPFVWHTPFEQTTTSSCNKPGILVFAQRKQRSGCVRLNRSHVHTAYATNLRPRTS